MSVEQVSQLICPVRNVENSFARLRAEFLATQDTVAALLEALELSMPGQTLVDSTLNSTSEISVLEEHRAGENTGEDILVPIAEPRAIVQHRIDKNQQKRVDLAAKSRAFDEDVLRLHPDWMDLSLRCKQMLTTSVEAVRSTLREQSARKKSRKRESVILRSIGKVEMHCRKLGFSGPVLNPHSSSRLCWGVIGLIMLACDLLVLPMDFVWDIDKSSTTTLNIIFQVIFWLTAVFWTIDVTIVNFNTAYYESGTLVSDRTMIARRYFRGWFAFDLILVLLDCVVVFVRDLRESNMAHVRSLRVLRALRMVRLIKMNRIASLLEEAAMSSSKQWFVLVLSILKAGALCFLLLHVLACGWIYIGMEVMRSGHNSWLVYTRADDLSMGNQYLHALTWILCPPSPPELDADSSIEYLYNIVIVVFVVGCLGVSLSGVTDTMASLRAVNLEKDMKMRHVQAYMHTQKVPVALASRILRFAEHKLNRMQGSVCLDMSLISPALQGELNVSQRSDVLCRHHVFALVKQLFPEAFASICGAFQSEVHEKNEPVFQAGNFLSYMCFTAFGKYKLSTVEGQNEEFTSVRWFNELSIYTGPTIQQITLIPATYSEMFTIRGEALRTCIQEWPLCVDLLVEYAQEFLQQVRKTNNPLEHDECSLKACRQTSYCLRERPEPQLHIHNMEVEVASGACDIEQNCTNALSVQALIEEVMQGEHFNLDKLCRNLQIALPEIHKEHGTHALHSQAFERDRSESACLNILFLLADKFEDFRSPQPTASRLTSEQWLELRRIATWINPSVEEIHAVLVLLAIRSLGKYKSIVKQLPTDVQRPEKAVVHLMKKHSNVVPSVGQLSDKSFSLVVSALDLHECFNFAQMLQGENVPASLLHLKNVAEVETSILQFYMLFLIGFMSGLAGGCGSKFMDSKNAEAVLAGCRNLQKLMVSTPQAIYWDFIIFRARQLSFSPETAEDLVLSRLACLVRAQDASYFEKLQATWYSISLQTRNELVSHLLADGIEEKALLLEFLPLCISNASANPVVKLQGFLEMLVELIQGVLAFTAQVKEITGQMVLHVDLAEFAEFINAVKSQYVFHSCMSRCSFQIIEGRVKMDVGHGNWSRVHETENDIAMIASSVRDIYTKMQHLEVSRSTASGTHGQSHPSRRTKIRQPL